MWFGVLGLLTVRVGENTIVVPPGKQRVVLAALLLKTGQVVSFDELAEIVWDGSPPRSSHATLRNYVKRLRQVLGPVAGKRIVTYHPGYLVEATGDEVDLVAFERECQEGTAAAQAGEWLRASQLIRDALRLWRGVPLSDVPSETLVRDHLHRLEQLRLHALETRIEADLCLGRHREVIAELQALVDQDPLREHPHALLMLALYRDGRQRDALAAYQVARDSLLDELGVEPGPELRQLHQWVLDGDPRLDLGGDADRSVQRVSHATGFALTVPRQLPIAAWQFSGRQRELRRLNGLLDQAEAVNGAAVVAVICGTPGVGKTTLAIHWAHQVAARFPDGQLHANLRGFDAGPPVLPAQVIRYFLDGLGVPAEQIPADFEAQASLYRSLLAGRRMLIALDNARDSAQLRPLMPAAPGCLVIVTSRSQLTGLTVREGAHLLSLDVLSAEDARELVISRSGHERTEAGLAAVDELVQLCARLPLALAVAAARITVHPQLSLPALVAELRDVRNRLNALDASDPGADVRSVFAWSYQSLTASSASMFRLLSIHPGPDITVPAAASLAGLPVAHASEALTELVAAHLVEERIPGRYAFHDLLRIYASEQARGHDDDAQRRMAAIRALDHYLHTAHAGAQLLTPVAAMPTLTPHQTGVAPERPVTYEGALAWFKAEHQVLLAAVDRAQESGFDLHAWQLPRSMRTFLDRQGHWRDQVAVQQIAVAAAQRSGTPEDQARAHRELSVGYTRLGSYNEASDHLTRALSLYEELGDQTGQADTHQSTALVFERQGRYGEAARHAQQAGVIYRATGNQLREAVSLNNRGWCLAQLGDYQQAITCCEQALDLHGKFGNRPGEAATLDTLGYIHQRLGDHGKSTSRYLRAAALLAETGNIFGQAITLDHIGDNHLAAGHRQKAGEAWRQALRILDDLRRPDAEHIREKLRGLAADGSLRRSSQS
jgi:DNA-binding SARP family transcriptional activator/Tfp pilus assembly protein PilF